MTKLYQILKAYRKHLPVIIIIGCVWLAYSNTLNVPFIFDDRSSIEENPSIRHWYTVFFPPGKSGLTVSGRPVVNATVALNYALGGMNVTGYHILNVWVHMLAGLTLFGIVRRTLKLASLGGMEEADASVVALLFSLLWALHPLQTESVTYMIQRAESIVGLFYFLTLYTFIRGAVESDNKRWYLLSVCSCFLGMGSKEVMASAPFIVLLFDRAFVSSSFRELWTKRRWYYISLGATWLLLLACIIATGKRGSTVGYNEFATGWRYALTQCVAIAHYIKLTFWPRLLVLDYGQTLAYGFKDAAWQSVVLACLLTGTVVLWFKKPKLGFLGLMFFAVLAPSSSIVPVLTQTMAEHRMYIAVAPVLAFVFFPLMQYFRSITYILWTGFAVVVLFGLRTYFRNSDYKTEENIWKTVTFNCPYNTRGWASLAHIYADKGDMPLAKATARQALKYNSKNTDALCAYGEILKKMKETVEAEEVFRYALEYAPTSYNANLDLATLLLEANRAVESIDYFQRAIAADPAGVEAHHNLGKAYVALGRYEDAVKEFAPIVHKDPKAEGARNNLGNALHGCGRTAEAIQVLNEGLKINKDALELHRTLGVIFLNTGDLDKAKAEFEQVLKINAKDAKAHANLGLLYTTEGNSNEACLHYKAALQNKGELTDELVRGVRINLADEYTKAGLIDDAIQEYEAVIQLAPGSMELRYIVANYLLRHGRCLAAIPHYEEVIKYQPDNLGARNELGVAYMAAGKLTEARQQFEAVLAQQPSHAGARENLKKLDSLRR